MLCEYSFGSGTFLFGLARRTWSSLSMASFASSCHSSGTMTVGSRACVWCAATSIACGPHPLFNSIAVGALTVNPCMQMDMWLWSSFLLLVVEPYMQKC
ncbi:hypothetical protein BX070DRAFT_220026 [Coemansia spiralis]|nr:hypothetical protein BX070DRAFT_220026 [Coemansia spiralis]